MIKIQAHRGARKVTPENTMAAFVKAAALGADGIELDVHRLPDGTLVVHHDCTLGRCETVTNSLYEYNKETIKSFSAGETFSTAYQEEKIPYFSEVLDFLRTNSLFLNCEIKADFGFVGIDDAVIALLEQYNMRDRCIVSSFNHYILKSIKAKYPRYQVGALYDFCAFEDVVAYAVQNCFDAIHPYHGGVTKELAEAAHRHGIAVNVWTVNDEEVIKSMQACGVDTIITDDVETAVALLR